jgi:hypothetical protein
MAGFKKPIATLFVFLFALVAVQADSNALRGDVTQRRLGDSDQGFRPVSLSHRVYAQKPKITLLGKGFEKFKRTEIHLTLEINGETLEQFEDYTLDIATDERIQLKLNEGKEWWGSSKSAGALILKKAVFDASPQTGDRPSSSIFSVLLRHVVMHCYFPANINVSAWRSNF